MWILVHRPHHVDEQGRVQAINYTSEGIYCLTLQPLSPEFDQCGDYRLQKKKTAFGPVKKSKEELIDLVDSVCHSKGRHHAKQLNS